MIAACNFQPHAIWRLLRLISGRKKIAPNNGTMGRWSASRGSDSSDLHAAASLSTQCPDVHDAQLQRAKGPRFTALLTAQQGTIFFGDPTRIQPYRLHISVENFGLLLSRSVFTTSLRTFFKQASRCQACRIFGFQPTHSAPMNRPLADTSLRVVIATMVYS